MKSPRAEQWAAQIRTELGKTVESIVEVGRLLLKAKGDLPHGEWGRMFDDGLIPLKQGAAIRYMAVASHPVLSNSAHAPNLPPSWYTLYELTKLPEPTLKNAMHDGLITPDMERKDVKALLPAKPSSGPVVVVVNGETGEVVAPGDGESEPQAMTVEVGEPFDARSAAGRAVHAIRSIVADWPHSVSLEPMIKALRFEADRLEQRQQRLAS